MTNSSLNRRQFLRTTATVATAAPFLLPSRVWGASTSANDRITIGCIGMGTQNRGLTGGALGRPDVQVVAVCDVDQTRREAARQTVEERYAKQTGKGTYHGCVAYGDFRRLLARRDIDAVIIATPDHWHALISIAAAKAGKDIYCEKPLCQSINEADAMVQAVRKYRRVFQTGSMQRSMSEFRKACELVRNGVLGKLQKIEVAVGGPPHFCDLPPEPDEAGLHWNLWLGPAPVRPYHSALSPRGVHKHFPNWRLYREYGGGMVTDWGAHHFDIAQWALGMDDDGPAEVIPPDDPKATHGARVLYRNGVEVIHRDGNGVTFHGTEGTIYVNRGQFKATPENLAEYKLGLGAIRLEESHDHMGNWLHAVRTRVRPICDVAVGASTVTVCHLVNLAYFYREKMKWDPVRVDFADKTGNPLWLETVRPYRHPWKLKI